MGYVNKTRSEQQSNEIRTWNINDFDYELPQELIAQTPVEPRDSSRLLVLDRVSGVLSHRHFRDIGDYLRPGDLLIANQSRVIPARLLGRRAVSGGQVEVLLLTERPDLGTGIWETLVRPGRRLHEGSIVHFGPAKDILFQAEILQRTEAGGRVVRFTLPQDQRGQTSIHALIDTLGRMPLPPYIHETLQDPERYQTVYARIRGSAAAPTAGLHFTPALLDSLRERGVRIGFVTLHVGLDTFRPIEVEDFREHKMHSEEIDLDEPTAELIQQTRREGGRVIAVGTTAVRVLESIATIHQGHALPYHGSTNLFITPGYQFQLVDAMITNFHLPRSSLLLLVSAFASKAHIEKAYQEAIRKHYRFFSFGDAMLLL